MRPSSGSLGWADLEIGRSLKAKGGFSREQIEAELKRGGSLPVWQALRCRVRYFTEGIALGTQGFLAEFGEGKQWRARASQLEGAEFGGLMFYGQRRVDGIRAPS